MNYWDYPLITFDWPTQDDIIADIINRGKHRFFYDPAMTLDSIKTNQHLDDMISWANNWLITDGVDGFLADQRNHYDIANLVKLNMWIDDIRKQGIVKPWLCLDQNDGTFIAATGDSRLRCLEVIPEIKTISTFIATDIHRADLYHDLEPITSLARWGEICQAEQKQQWMFRPLDESCPWGLYWYEYASPLTRNVTPSTDWCLNVFRNYATKNPGLQISKTWFSNAIQWKNYSV